MVDFSARPSDLHVRREDDRHVSSRRDRHGEWRHVHSSDRADDHGARVRYTNRDCIPPRNHLRGDEGGRRGRSRRGRHGGPPRGHNRVRGHGDDRGLGVSP